MSLAAGSRIASYEILSDMSHAGFDLFADGTFVTVRPGTADPEVIVVTNWISELKKGRQ